MMYREDEVIVFRTLLNYVQKVYIWPKNGGTFDAKLLAKFVVPNIIIGSPIFLGVVGHFYKSFFKHGLLDLVDDILYSNYILLYISSALIGFFVGPRALKLFQGLSRVEPEYRIVYQQLIDNIDFKTKVLYYIISIDVCLFTFGRYLSNSFCDGTEGDLHYVCGTMFPLWYPIEIDKRFKPIFAIQVFAVAMVLTPNLSANIVLYYTNRFIIIKINHIIACLRRIRIEDGDVGKTRTEFINCVDNYIEVTRLLNLTNGTVGNIFILTHNAYNVIMIGLCGHIIVVGSHDLGSDIIPNSLQLLVWISTAWISCYSGQCIEDAHASLKNELYSISWYNMDPSLKTTFKIFQEQLSYRFHMTIQPFTILNLNYFSEIMKGAYTFFMFLQRMHTA